jgi:hypothetical protein
MLSPPCFSLSCANGKAESREGSASVLPYLRNHPPKYLLRGPNDAVISPTHHFGLVGLVRPWEG